MPDMKAQTIILREGDKTALQYLGAAVVLQWSKSPRMCGNRCCSNRSPLADCRSSLICTSRFRHSFGASGPAT